MYIHVFYIFWNDRGMFLIVATQMPCKSMSFIMCLILPVGPFAMVTYLALETDWSGKGFPWQHNNTVGVWDVVCVSRAFRWVSEEKRVSCLAYLQIM